MSAHDDYLDPDYHLWEPEEPEGYEEAWQFMNELYGLPDDNKDNSKIERGVYKYTDCGAWISFREDGIELGSIVEGCDFEVPPVSIGWKDIPNSFTETLDTIDKQACAVWEWANEERDDGMTDADAGLDCPIDDWSLWFTDPKKAIKKEVSDE